MILAKGVLCERTRNGGVRVVNDLSKSCSKLEQYQYFQISTFQREREEAERDQIRLWVASKRGTASSLMLRYHECILNRML